MILVTGGCGFIGSNFVLDWLAATDEPVLNLDKLTYAGSRGNVEALAGDARHTLVPGDIADGVLLRELLARHQPRAIVHLAAESHVDRSIARPQPFIATNVAGTFELLEAARAYWQGLPGDRRGSFRFLHVSTDEVYGSLGPQEPPFTERSAYDPHSPYAASKAAADHLARACWHTWGMPVLVTNCSNNYGPRQMPEKLIPRTIDRALAGEPLPVYGDGRQVRDWLHVADHCAALRLVLQQGDAGETYNIGAACEKENLDVVRSICGLLDELRPRAAGGSYAQQIAFVPDRPGHDRRYAMDARKLRAAFGWMPQHSFEAGLRRTVEWYLGNVAWLAAAHERAAA